VVGARKKADDRGKKKTKEVTWICRHTLARQERDRENPHKSTLKERPAVFKMNKKKEKPNEPKHDRIAQEGQNVVSG